MNIDLNSLMRQAQEEVESAESRGNNNNGIPVVYPGEKGKITFRILYNIKSQTIHRKIVRHGKVPCMSIYGEDCPVCTAIKNAEEVKGKDCGAFSKYGYKIRGICYAKVVEADSAYSDKFKAGDTIILMYPKTVYEAINKIIVDAGANLEKVVSHNDGIPLVLETTTKTNGYPDYDVRLFPYGSQKLFDDDNGEQMFDELLDSIPSLSETILSKLPTEEDRNKVKAMAETITQEYIYGNVVNPGEDASKSQPQPEADPSKSVNPAFNPTPTAAQNAPSVEQTQTQTQIQENIPIDQQTASQSQVQDTQSTAGSVPNGMPECFGQHSDSENKCLICSNEAECFMKTHRG